MPPWADLRPELVQLIAESLVDDDRQALVRTTKSWCAAIAAVPDLWPTAVVTAPFELAVDSWDDEELLQPEQAREFRLDDMLAEERVLNEAAQLDGLTWRVRLEGGKEHALLWCGVLAVLPSTLRDLHLDAVCAGPLLTVLRRFRHLRLLTITGNGAGISWGGPGAALVVDKLSDLCLDYRQRREWDGDLCQDAEVLRPDDSVARCLSAATRLHSLTLMVEWGDSVRTLCRAIPALRDLRLSLYYCKEGQATAALTMLRRMRSLASLSLEIHSYYGTESSDGDWPDIEPWEIWVHTPNLAAISALTRLRLVGAASLPSGWTQLSSLQSLEVVNDADVVLQEHLHGDGLPSWGGFTWGEDPLNALTALTQLTISRAGVLPDASLIATAPALKEVVAWGRDRQWWEELYRLRPDIGSGGSFVRQDGNAREGEGGSEGDNASKDTTPHAGSEHLM